MIDLKGFFCLFLSLIKDLKTKLQDYLLKQIQMKNQGTQFL